MLSGVTPSPSQRAHAHARTVLSYSRRLRSHFQDHKRSQTAQPLDGEERQRSMGKDVEAEPAQKRFGRGRRALPSQKAILPHTHPTQILQQCYDSLIEKLVLLLIITIDDIAASLLTWHYELEPCPHPKLDNILNPLPFEVLPGLKINLKVYVHACETGQLCNLERESLPTLLCPCKRLPLHSWTYS